MSRSAKGVRRHGKGWSYRYSAVDPVTGKRVWREVGGFPTAKAAERARTETLSKINRGQYVEPNRQTVSAYFDGWLKAHRLTVRDTTASKYESLINNHIKPHLGAVPLQSLRAPDLEALYAGLLANGRRNGEGGLGVNTVAAIHALMKQALGDALARDLIGRNPADLAKAPSQQRPTHTTWTAQQARTFIERSTGHRLYPLFHLALTTALRRGEALGLWWSDIDLDAMRLHVRRQLVAASHHGRYAEPKTDRARRTIELDAGTVAVLRAHRSKQAQERLMAGPAWVDEGLVFCREDGSPLIPRSVTASFKRACTAAKVPVLTFHQQRHTHITLALSEGAMSVNVASQRAGHANVGITLSTYRHVMDGEQRAGADLFGALLANDQGGQSVGK